MYKFFGTPLKEITSKLSGKILFRFDTKGEFITDDTEIIGRALGFFDHIELNIQTVGEIIKKTFITPELTIITNEEIKLENSKHCKKCEFTCNTQNELMTHYKSHKKEVIGK